MRKRRAKRKKDIRDFPADRSPLTAHPSAAQAALLIFAKAPLPGQVKTRLCPPLTPDEAATLHGTFVLDILERSKDAQKRARLAFDRYLSCSPSADHVYFKILGARHGVGLETQTGEDLGARMLHAFETLFARGYSRVVMVGTDIPSLPAHLLNEALERLDAHEVVLGPALDGGYYLIGLVRPIPHLFRGVPWSTPDVLSVTQKIAAGLGLRLALLAPQRDVDRLEDLQAVMEECGLEVRGKGSAEMQQKKARSSPLASDRSPLTPLVSKRTAGVLHALAKRLRGRTESGKL